MFCPKCNTILDNNAKFCTNCGARIAPEQPGDSQQPLNQNINGEYQQNPNPNYNGEYQQNPNPNYNGGYQQNPNPSYYGNYQQNPNPNYSGGYQQYPNQNYGPYQQGYTPIEPDGKASFGWRLLSFFIPLAGLVLYLTRKDKKPQFAKSCGIAAIIGLIVSMVWAVLVNVLTYGVFYNNPAADEFYADFAGLYDNLIVGLFSFR